MVTQGYSPLAKGRALRAVEVKAVAEQIGKLPSQVLVRWCMQHHVPVVPKSTKLDHVMQNSQVECTSSLPLEDVYSYSLCLDDYFLV